MNFVVCSSLHFISPSFNFLAQTLTLSFETSNQEKLNPSSLVSLISLENLSVEVDGFPAEGRAVQLQESVHWGTLSSKLLWINEFPRLWKLHKSHGDFFRDQLLWRMIFRSSFILGQLPCIESWRWRWFVWSLKSD